MRRAAEPMSGSRLTAGPDLSILHGIRPSRRHAMQWKIAAAILASLMTPAGFAASLGGPLRLSDEGSFFVSGRSIDTSFAGLSPAGPVPRGKITVDQMYVHY